VVSRVSWALSSLAGIALWAAAVPAHSQSNLDAGKSAAQIFASTCSNCHRSPREIRRTTASFMREHYTTGSQEAATMAAYLASVGSDPKAVEQRRRPGMGAGQGPSEAAAKPGQSEAGKTSEANGRQAGLVRPRRPADSMEVFGPLAEAAGPADSPAAPAAPTAAVPGDLEE